MSTRMPNTLLTRSAAPRIAATLFFLGLLAAAVVLSRAKGDAAGAGEAGRGSRDTTGALARYGFRLEEVSRAAGLEFTHQAPTLDPKLDHIMPQVASMGAGVAVADFDRDGWRRHLRRPTAARGAGTASTATSGDGTFQDVAGGHGSRGRE